MGVDRLSFALEVVQVRNNPDHYFTKSNSGHLPNGLVDLNIFAEEADKCR